MLQGDKQVPVTTRCGTYGAACPRYEQTSTWAPNVEVARIWASKLWARLVPVVATGRTRRNWVCLCSRHEQHGKKEEDMAHEVPIMANGERRTANGEMHKASRQCRLFAVSNFTLYDVFGCKSCCSGQERPKVPQ